jgi:Zn-dependent M28 family amino/carboxypeptidase
VKHPLFPLARTVADINLEQLGEPDSDDELTPGSIGATGYAFTDLPRLLAPAFQSEGVTLRDAPDNVDFYDRSDNLPFAQAGIPTHTFAAAFTFPDYHLVSDEWPKLDYENLAKLNRGLAAAILALANSAESPKWNEGNKQTREYAKAWHALHP